MGINLFLVLAVVGLGLFLVLPWWQALIMYLPILAAYLYTAWRGRQAQELPPVTGKEAMIGNRAEVVRVVDNVIRVHYQGEVWAAVSTQPVHPGQKVIIQDVQGLTLVVAPLSSAPVE